MPDFGLGALFGGGMSMLGNYQNFKYQQKLMEQQNQYNVDMWKMQADYNSPQAQMQRYSQAGLNPNLIYGQGTNGNMTSAPVQGVPDAPDYSHGLGEIGEGIGRLFNIENLRTIRANRKKAEADARSAQTDADRNEMEFDADITLGATHGYDYKTGRYYELPLPGFYGLKKLAASNYYKMRNLASNYGRNYLVPIRGTLLGSQNLLVGSQRSYLQPQIAMAQYENRFKPYSFWIGQGSKVLNSLPLPKFTIKHDFGRKDYYKHY